ncbi:ABC transporter substrate-binding protein [Ekhidna sp.]|uniref:ABC transporter substrate-binding protein n=1 Tax=Ekhidna sp. TaxID=2608089 RepID=UPI003299B885
MSNKNMIITVEESANILGFYDPETGQRLRQIHLSLWPHEVAVDSKGERAYVTNFGVRDYDLSIGFAGNSISVIDIKSMAEIDRLYTTDLDISVTTWAPHGVKVSPDDKYLYVNVERTEESRYPSPGVSHGQEHTKMLVYDLKTKKIANSFSLESGQIPQEKDYKGTDFNPLVGTYELLPGTHNFVFSPDGKFLWLFSGVTGVTKINPLTGEVLARMTDFNGAVRSLAFSTSGMLLVSATNEVSLVDTEKLQIIKKYGDLGVGQILYSKITYDEKYIIAPAVWEGKILIIDVKSGKIIKRITTGIDPVQIELSPDGKTAISTHGRSNWLSEIDLTNFSISKRIQTTGGPNGAKYVPMPKQPIKKEALTLCAFLPFTNKYGAEGREIRLGYQFWNEKVNKAGGLYHNGKSYKSDIIFIDTESADDPKSLTDLFEHTLKSEKIDILIGSYGYEASNALAAVADKHGVFNLTSTLNAPIKGVKYKNTTNLNAFDHGNLIEALSAIFSSVTPKPDRMLVISSDSKDLTEETKILIAKLKGRNVQVIKDKKGSDYFTIPAAGIDGFTEEIIQKYPDVVFVNGSKEDLVRLIKSFDKYYFTPGAIVINQDLSFSYLERRLHKLREGLLYMPKWSKNINNSSQDRFGSAFDFDREYYDEYSERPTSLAAGGAAVGVILEELLRNASSLDAKDLHKVMKELDYQIFYDLINIGSNGDNSKKQPYVIQVQDNDHIVVWPRHLAKNNRIRLNNT